jgi:hypothetical protein
VIRPSLIVSDRSRNVVDVAGVLTFHLNDPNWFRLFLKLLQASSCVKDCVIVSFTKPYTKDVINKSLIADQVRLKS